MTRNTDKKVSNKLFQKFSEEEEQQVEYGDIGFASQSSLDNRPSFRVQTIMLNPLEDDDALNLLLANCSTILTKDDFGPNET